MQLEQDVVHKVVRPAAGAAAVRHQLAALHHKVRSVPTLLRLECLKLTQPRRVVDSHDFLLVTSPGFGGRSWLASSGTSLSPASCSGLA